MILGRVRVVLQATRTDRLVDLLTGLQHPILFREMSLYQIVTKLTLRYIRRFKLEKGANLTSTFKFPVSLY